MNSPKPIIPGCRAMIINSLFGHNGKIVNVLRKSSVTDFECPDSISVRGQGWSIDAVFEGTGQIKISDIIETQLMRLDDDDPDSKRETANISLSRENIA